MRKAFIITIAELRCYRGHAADLCRPNLQNGVRSIWNS